MIMMIFLQVGILKASMMMLLKEFPPSGEFNGIDSVQYDDDFPSSEDLHGDPMTLVRMVIIFLLSLIFLLLMRLLMKMMMGLGMKIMF
jgi:hypothetical protein